MVEILKRSALVSVTQRETVVHADVNQMWTIMSRTMTNLTAKIWCGILPSRDDIGERVGKADKERDGEKNTKISTSKAFCMHIILSSLLQRIDNLQKRSCLQRHRHKKPEKIRKRQTEYKKTRDTKYEMRKPNGCTCRVFGGGGGRFQTHFCASRKQNKQIKNRRR